MSSTQLDLAKIESLAQICRSLDCFQVTSSSIVTRCIYCGDSRRKLKNYGHFYIFRHTPIATCFRCGQTVSLFKWLKDLKIEKPHLAELCDETLAILKNSFGDFKTKSTTKHSDNVEGNLCLLNTKQKILSALELRVVDQLTVFDVIYNRCIKDSDGSFNCGTLISSLELHHSQSLNEFTAIAESKDRKLYLVLFGYNEVVLRELDPTNLVPTKFMTTKVFGWPHFLALPFTLKHYPSQLNNVVFIENFFDCIAANQLIPSNICFITNGKKNLETALYVATQIIPQQLSDAYYVADFDTVSSLHKKLKSGFMNFLTKKHFSKNYLVIPASEDLWQDLMSLQEPLIREV